MNLLNKRATHFSNIVVHLAAPLGVAILHQSHALSTLPISFILTLIVLALWYWHSFVIRAIASNKKVPSVALTFSLTLILSLTLGWSYAHVRAKYRLSNLLSASQMGQIVDINVTIKALPKILTTGNIKKLDSQKKHQGYRKKSNSYYGKPSIRYEVAVDNPPIGIPNKIRLIERTNALPMKAGSHWRLKVRLYPLHGSANPHGFDYEAWLFEHGFGATGSIRERIKTLPSKTLMARLANWLSISRLQEKLLYRLQNFANLHALSVPEVVPVLGLGIQSRLTGEYWETLRISGTIHLFSISGIHVTLLALLLGQIAKHCWRYSAVISLALVNFMPSWWAGRWISILAAWSYGVLSGMGVPTLRTLLMMSLFTLIQRLGWYTDWRKITALVLFLMVLIDPWVMNAPGFWLSFAGVTILMSTAPSDIANNLTNKPTFGYQQSGNKRGTLIINAIKNLPASFISILIKAVLLQIKLSLLLTPLLIIFFHQWAPASLIANLIAVPWVSFLMLPLTLLIIIVPNTFAIVWLTTLQSSFFWVMDIINSVLPSQNSPAPTIGALIFASIGAVVLLMPRGVRAKWLGVPLFMPLIIGLANPTIPYGMAKITMLDVGAGLSVLIQTQHHNIVMDTGAEHTRYSAVKYSLLPMLRAEGIKKIDTLILSHADNDHAGGTNSLLNNVTVQKIIWGGRKKDWQSTAYQPAMDNIRHQKINGKLSWQNCKKQMPWKFDGVLFTPMTAHDDENTLSENNASCALKISAGAHSLLLSADLENKGLRLFIKKYGTALKSSVLQLPHHGSDSSYLPAFFKKVAPSHVLLSGGPRQRHYPAKKMTQSLMALNTPPLIHHTWFDGALTLILSPNNPPIPQSFRQSAPHYWHKAISDIYQHRPLQ